MKSKLLHPKLLMVLSAAIVCGVAMPQVAAQSEILMPEQSAAKANEVMKLAIEALGGSAYLNVRDLTCTGRLGQFDHSGELTGYEKFVDYAKPPFKERTENLPQHNQIDIFNGDAGWNLDRGGVSEEPVTQVIQFVEDTKKDIDNVLRHRIHEPGMIIRYAGQDVVDLKPAEWVELIDSDNRTIRIAFDSSTHLPLRKVVESRDPKLRTVTSELEYYSLFYPTDGVMLAKQVTRERNGMKVYQIFFDKCDLNTGVQDSMFTKQSLQDWYNKLPKKYKTPDKKKKDDKKNNKDDGSDDKS